MHAVNYTDKRGWFIRLDKYQSGLPLASSPQLGLGREVFQALSPIDDAASAFALRPGKSVNLVLHPLTGSAVSMAPPLNGHGDGALSSATGQTSVAGGKLWLRRSWRQILNRPAPGTITHAGGN